MHLIFVKTMRYSVHVAGMDALVRPGPDVNHADIFQPRVLYTAYKHVVNATLREVTLYGRTTGSYRPSILDIKLVGLRITDGNCYATYGRSEDHTMRSIGVFTSAEIAAIAASDD
jgi:hypothetical protein